MHVRNRLQKSFLCLERQRETRQGLVAVWSIFVVSSQFCTLQDYLRW